MVSDGPLWRSNLASLVAGWMLRPGLFYFYQVRKHWADISGNWSFMMAEIKIESRILPFQELLITAVNKRRPWLRG